MDAISFKPIAISDAEILILGSMPGKVSLAQQEYYAHKQNAFWRILFNLFNENEIFNYDEKIRFLHKNKIALWDSLAYCERKSSLDSDIKHEIPNDFDAFLATFPNIKTIAFNGKAAERYYKKHIGFSDKYRYVELPSTSPAHASMSFEGKLDKWRVIL